MFPLLIIFTLFPIFSLSQNVEQFVDCTTKLYRCGESIQWIGYPFWGEARPSYCGLRQFHLTCRDDVVSTLQVGDTTFRVLRIDPNINRVTLARDDLWEEPGTCSLQPQESMNDTTFKYTVFTYIPDDFLFLGLHYSCLDSGDPPIPIRNRLNCSRDDDGGGRVSFFEDGSLSLGERECENEISVPVLRRVFAEFVESGTVPLWDVLRQGFPLDYRVDGGGVCSRCENSGGTCWSYPNSSAPSCLCRDGVSRLLCPRSGTNWRMKLS